MATETAYRTTYWTIAVLLLVGLGLTIASSLGICTAECVVGHHYRLYGFRFETIGFAFFIGMIVYHLFTWWSPTLLNWLYLMIIGALGAEALFLMVQKYWIGHWCPICVSIAATLTLAALILTSYFIQKSRKTKENSMNMIWKSSSTLAVFVLGFTFAFFGVSQVNPLDAKDGALKEQLRFGNKNSHIEVYVFTDWACPACRKVEPLLESMAPSVMKQAQLYFVDYVIHPETLNYSPYNVSFMLNNKEKYLVLRHVLTKLAQETGSPTEDQVEAIAEKINTPYKPLSYSEVAMATKYFKKLGTQYRVNRTPTVIVIDTITKKGKRLEGTAEITQQKVLSAIFQLKSSET